MVHVPLTQLWLPILLATVLTFFGGFVLHMLLPLHKSDWKGLPNEADALAAMRKAGVGPGMYLFPFATDMKAMRSPEFIKKQEEGPCGIMTIRQPGPVSMGPYLGKQLVFHLVISFFLAYLASRTLDPGTAYLQVFRVVGTAGILAYGAAVVPEAIWYQASFRFTLNQVIDGIVWGLLTAGSFGAFWPK